MVFDRVKTEDFGSLRANALTHLVKDEDSAKIIVDKVNETKDIVQNMDLNPSLLGNFSSNAFILLAIKGHDSSALQLYKDFGTVFNEEMIKRFSNSKMDDMQESKEILNNFLKKHEIKFEEKK